MCAFAQVVLVRALHQLTGEMATVRAEAKRHEEASKRSLSTAWRLGQLGQLGLALLETGDDDPPPPPGAGGGYAGGRELEGPMRVSEPELDRRWEALLRETESSPPLTERLMPPSAAEAGGTHFRGFDDAVEM